MTSTNSPILLEGQGRRERKKHATRQALHETALALTEARGFANLTVEAITDEVDVAMRTFFNYYSSKEEAVLGPRSDPSQLGIELTGRLRAGQHPLEALKATLLADVILQDTTTDRLRRRTQLLRSEPTLLATAAAQWEVLSRSLAEAVAEATGLDAHTDAYPTLFVMVAVAALRASMMRWVDNPALPLAVVVDESFGLLGAGLPYPRPGPGEVPAPITTRGAGR